MQNSKDSLRACFENVNIFHILLKLVYFNMLFKFICHNKVSKQSSSMISLNYELTMLYRKNRVDRSAAEASK